MHQIGVDLPSIRGRSGCQRWSLVLRRACRGFVAEDDGGDVKGDLAMLVTMEKLRFDTTTQIK